MISHLKRRIGVLSAIAVMAALVPVLTSSSVSAAPLTTAADPALPSPYEACPGSASIPSAGFTDTTSTDVDCIAYYGITTGVTATTYEPSANIPRWQMALYLTRAADKAGHTLGSGADQGFTDISGYSAAIQTGINQLKQMGVTTGTTATTYDPDSNVTREQMSMFVERLLGKTAVGPSGAAVSSPDGLTTNISLDGSDADAYNYTDIDGAGITFEGHNAIEELYNLGVYGHLKATTTFSPAADITRADMATWLTNALGHTNLRPAGVNIQLSKNSGFANSPTASVTYRDSSHAPVSGQVIDMFQWVNSATVANNSSWDAAGNCATAVAIVGNSLTKCVIDVGDPSTNANGNIDAGTVAQTAGVTTSYWAWTGTSTTKYDNDVHAADASTVNGTSSALATVITVSCDANAYSTTSNDAIAGFLDANSAKFGTTITLTMQASAAVNGLTYAPVAQPLLKINVTEKVGVPGGTTAVASQTTTALYTDANGTATYSFTQADPNLVSAVSANTDDVLVNIVVNDGASADGVQSVAVPRAVAAADGASCWSDDIAVEGMSFDFQDDVSGVGDAVSHTVAQNVASYKAAALATSPISRTSTVTMRDKYGDVVPSATGGAVFYGSAADALVVDADVAVQASNEGTQSIDPGTGASSLTLYPVDSGICFVALDSTPSTLTIAGSRPVIGTTYYVQAGAVGLGGTANEALKISLTSGGAAETLAGNTKVGDKIAAVHPTMGCGARSVGPVGTASIAWNDTNTGTGLDQVYVTTSVADTAAALAGSTSMRWIAPSTTALNTDTAGFSSAVWTMSGADDCDGDNDVCGQPMIVDTVGNTMVMALIYDSNTGGTTITTLYTSYNWDDNDFFYINDGAVATSIAGFEGSYKASATAGTLGLLNHFADGSGSAYSKGDMYGVSYQALAGNTSVFKLGN